MKSRRIGRFVLNRNFIEANKELAREIMGRCIVVRCEMVYYSDALEYIALSPDFDEIPEHSIAPEYQVICTDNEGNITFMFKRVE